MCCKMSTDLDKALSIHKREGTPPNVIAHCRAVNKFVLETWSRIKKKNPSPKADERLLFLGSLLHDIGRSESHGLDHGALGAGIIRKCSMIEPELRENIARVCETHIGAGISKKEARALGLPEGSYLPKTIEQKIIAYCDNLVDGTRLRGEEWCVGRFRKIFGDSPITKRLVALNALMDKLK